MPARPTQESWNVVACIFVEVFSVGTGAVEIDVSVDHAHVEGKNELPQVKLFGRSEGRPFELIDTRRLGK
jgi:hypothetical protein